MGSLGTLMSGFLRTVSLGVSSSFVEGPRGLMCNRGGHAFALWCLDTSLAFADRFSFFVLQAQSLFVAFFPIDK